MKYILIFITLTSFLGLGFSNELDPAPRNGILITEDQDTQERRVFRIDEQLSKENAEIVLENGSFNLEEVNNVFNYEVIDGVELDGETSVGNYYYFYRPYQSYYSWNPYGHFRYNNYRYNYGYSFNWGYRYRCYYYY